MSKNKLLLLSLGAVLCFAGTAGALAQYTTEKTTENNLKFDTVDIDLEEYQLDDNSSLVDFINPSQQIPGSIISKIPRIYNKGSECWIRIKLSFSIDDEDLESINTDDLHGFQSEKWLQASDGYYYLLNSLDENSSVDVFDSVTIPSDWGNNYMDKNVYINVTAEAIQLSNFYPDFNSESPWGNQEIEECVRSRDFERGSES